MLETTFQRELIEAGCDEAVLPPLMRKDLRAMLEVQDGTE